MRWPWWLRLGRRRRNGHSAHAAQARAEQEAKLRQAERDSPVVDRVAERVAELPPDEFARRVQQAFQQRRHA